MAERPVRLHARLRVQGPFVPPVLVGLRRHGPVATPGPAPSSEPGGAARPAPDGTPEPEVAPAPAPAPETAPDASPSPFPTDASPAGVVDVEAAAAQPPALVAAVRSAEREFARDEHHDTADLRLLRDGIVLRRHETATAASWHLRLPVGPALEDLCRAEAGADLPADLAALLTARTRGEPVRPVVTLRTERVVHTLLDPHGDDVGTVVDDIVSVIDDRVVVARFRELEVTAVPAGPGRRAAHQARALLDAVVDALAAAGAVPTASGGVGPADEDAVAAARLLHALGSRATAQPEVPLPVHPRRDDPAGVAVSAFVRGQVRALLAHDPAVRLDRPDGVHQMRVACRRLRSFLKTFGPLVEPGWATATRGELAWLADSLGAARDAEVLLARLDRAVDELPLAAQHGDVHGLMRDHLDAGLADAREAAMRVLCSDRYLALLDSLVGAAGTPPLTPLADVPAGAALPPLAGTAYTAFTRMAARLSARRHAADERYHRARIAAKQARYAAEACQPVCGKPAARLADTLAEVQESLGEHQDACVAADTARALALDPGTSRDAGFTLGVLWAAERRRAETCRTEFHRLWPAQDRTRDRRWLRP